MSSQPIRQHSPLAQSIYNFAYKLTSEWYAQSRVYHALKFVKIRRLNLKEKTCKTYDNIFVAAKANKTTYRKLRHIVKKTIQLGDFISVKV